MIRTDKQGQPFSTEDLFRFGIDDVAYVKRLVIDGKSFYAVHSADGTPLMIAADRELAFAAVLQNNMNPASVH